MISISSSQFRLVFLKSSYRSLNKKPQCLNRNRLFLLLCLWRMWFSFTEEALFNIPKEKSPTLMIDGMLDDFAPEMETPKLARSRRRRGQALHLKKSTMREGMMMTTKPKILAKDTYVACHNPSWRTNTNPDGRKYSRERSQRVNNFYNGKGWSSAHSPTSSNTTNSFVFY